MIVVVAGVGVHVAVASVHGLPACAATAEKEFKEG
jgi:hypothetical protein